MTIAIERRLIALLLFLPAYSRAVCLWCLTVVVFTFFSRAHQCNPTRVEPTPASAVMKGE
ncbi:hypothetical protein BDW60DRAFT_62105 [Aspergillus nidulans var. acristatus]